MGRGSRDDAEFDEFVTARFAQLRRVAFLIVHDWQLAEDVVQTALAKVYVAWPRVREGSLEGYARRAVVNTSISLVRRPRRELLTDALPDRAAPPAPEPPDLQLMEALTHLSPAQSAVVALRFLEDMSVDEVSATLGVAPGTVKSHTSRALRHLRALMNETTGSNHD